MANLILEILPGDYAVHRLDPSQAIPPALLGAAPMFIARTADELSIVCATDIEVAAPQTEAPWRCLKVMGPLDFGLTGILAGIAQVLAQAEISIFAISTYDTDYILVRGDRLDQATAALSQAGYGLR